MADAENQPLVEDGGDSTTLESESTAGQRCYGFTIVQLGILLLVTTLIGFGLFWLYLGHKADGTSAMSWDGVFFPVLLAYACMTLLPLVVLVALRCNSSAVPQLVVNSAYMACCFVAASLVVMKIKDPASVSWWWIFGPIYVVMIIMTYIPLCTQPQPAGMEGQVCAIMTCTCCFIVGQIGMIQWKLSGGTLAWKWVLILYFAVLLFGLIACVCMTLAGCCQTCMAPKAETALQAVGGMFGFVFCLIPFLIILKLDGDITTAVTWSTLLMPLFVLYMILAVIALVAGCIYSGQMADWVVLTGLKDDVSDDISMSAVLSAAGANAPAA